MLNRKIIARLLGHIRTFTEWAKGAGLLDEDPGSGITVREATRTERAVEGKGAKRAFTAEELTRLFESPLYTGCRSRHYRVQSGPNVYRDAAWWLFATALLTGARLDKLIQAPSKLVDLDGVPCLDLRHGSKTLSAPHLAPIVRDLARLGFLA